MTNQHTSALYLRAVYSAILITILRGNCVPNYFLSDTKATRFEAHSLCRDLGLHLVNVDSQERSDQLFKKLQQDGKIHQYYWIGGLSYWTELESLRWWDYTGTLMRDYSNWCSDVGQPQELEETGYYNEPCTVLNYRGNATCWHDYPCFATFYYICEDPCEKEQVSVTEFCKIKFTPYTAPDAQKICEGLSFGKRLLTIDSNFRQQRLIKSLQEAGDKDIYWIGLKRKVPKAKDFYWNFGNGELTTYTNWKPGHPGNGDEDCVGLTYSGSNYYWEDYPCKNTFYFICD